MTLKRPKMIFYKSLKIVTIDTAQLNSIYLPLLIGNLSDSFSLYLQ